MSDPHYHSYMLRLWRDSSNHPWRASLQCTVTGETYAFADTLKLFNFLVEQLTREEESGELARLATWLRLQTEDGQYHEPFIGNP